MKWTNLSDSKPSADKNYAMRLLSRDMYFGTDDIMSYEQSDVPRDRREVVHIENCDGSDHHTWPTHVLEWLDEEVDDPTKDLEEAYKELQESIQELVAEQHKNTVEDACALLESWNKRANHVMIEGLKFDMSKLKQRKP